MRNYIIAFVIFIAVLFVIALAIGQSNDSDDIEYVDEFVTADETIEESIEKPIDEPIKEPIDEAQEQTPTSSSYDASAIEIPMATKAFPEQILVRVNYTTSYNKETKCPNWVAWHLEKDKTDGPCRREGVPYYDDDFNAYGIGKLSGNNVKGCYMVDLEAGPPRQEISDWYNIPPNTDHGHICPAADNRWSKTTMNQSFLLTNICPQDRDLNAGDWAGLETRCRGWAKRYSDIYIVAGPIFYNGVSKTMGDNKVGVPDAFFKVILRLEKEPKVIGFIFPNNGIHHELKDYVLSVDEVEEVTGIDFFHNLPDDMENDIEKVSNLNEW